MLRVYLRWDTAWGTLLLMHRCSWRGHLQGVFLEGTPVMGTYGFHYCPGVLGGDLRCGKEYEKELFEIGEVGVVLVGGREGGDLLEDDIENLKRSEDVIEMKKNDVHERKVGPKENRVNVCRKRGDRKVSVVPLDGGPTKPQAGPLYY
ncbi:hypothetical protein Tco_0255866 [Tanacetum coccineum]